LGWLALVLRDLAEGRLRVGFGAAKGLGQVTITAGTLAVGFLTPGDFPGDTDWLMGRPQAASGLYQVCSVSWADGRERDAWRGQVEAWVQQPTGLQAERLWDWDGGVSEPGRIPRRSGG
jgi:hypothetical protein